MNTIQSKLSVFLLADGRGFFFRAKLVLLALAILAGPVAKALADGTFASPYLIGGYWGSTNVDNSAAIPEPGNLTIAGQVQFKPVWFKFTATNDGVVTLDTVGSLTALGKPLDTVLAVFGGTNVAGLYQVAANDDLYPRQANAYSQSFFTNALLPDPPRGGFQYFENKNPPFTGPSILRFNVKSGSSYYVVADTKSAASGFVALNWAFHSAGVFRFASEVTDQRGLADTNGNAFLEVSAAEGSLAYVTITRVAGSSGRCTVRYSITNLPAVLVGANGFLTNNDIAAVAGTHFTATNGLLTFNDFEMSKTISFSVLSVADAANRDILVQLSEPQLDALESAELVSAPRVDPVYGQLVVRSLNTQVLPTVYSQVNTNPPPNEFVYTNWSGKNSAFNFSSTRYFVKRPQNDNRTDDQVVTIKRGGIPNQSRTNSATFFYVVNPDVSASPGYVENKGFNFPLSPGSEYAVPDPATSGNIFATTPDFTVPGGYSGTITFGADDSSDQYIPITIYPSTNANFNKDFQIQLYAVDTTPQNRKIRVGMVDSTVVTILFNDQQPPAGSVDELFNADFNLDFPDINITTTPADNHHPGTDGQVYGVATQYDLKSIVVGEFYTYNGFSRNCIARINPDGSLDTTFDPATSVGAIPGFDFPPIFINNVLVESTTTNGRIYIAGSFSSFNGTARGNVARLNSNGTLDTSFNSLAGANGPVYALLEQLDGKILIGGDFTRYNGTAITNIARLNKDGSLDITFNPGSALNAPVYALAQQINSLSADRGASGNEAEDINAVQLGATGGILTVDYDFYSIPDRMRVYYGGTNGVRIYDSGLTNGAAHVLIPFGPTNGLTTNTITIVMNQFSGVTGTVWDYIASIRYSIGDQTYAGGDFTSAGGLLHQDHIARFKGTGALDTTFDPNAGINGPVYALVVQSNGTIVVGGEFSQVNNLEYHRLVRLQTNGAVDLTFQSGVGVDGTVFNLNLQNDGKIYIGGAFSSVNGTHRLGFARLNPEGSVDTSFLDMAYNQFAGVTRERFSDPLGVVFSSGVLLDGGVIIGGSFNQVGGGQFNAKVRPTSNTNAFTTQFTRDGVRNRDNVARLIGGTTAGPGNISFLQDAYSANKSSSSQFVSLLRANGNLGYASANFSVLPQLAQSGLDFAYSGISPTYGIHWQYKLNPNTRMHSDGLFGTNTFLTSITGGYYQDAQSQVRVSIINNTTSSGDLNAKFQLANPGNADQFYLGGQNIPIGVALGASTAPLTIVDDQHQSGVVGLFKPDYVSSAGTAAIAVVRTNGNYGLVSVHYSTITNGSTAILGSDYLASGGTLNFLNGVSSNAFNITVLQSNYVSSVEKFVNLKLDTLQGPANGLVSMGRSNAVLRIINPNFAGYLNFSTNAYTGLVSAGMVPVTVTRTVGSKGTLSVQASTANGTAQSGTDYTAINTNLSWNNGDVSSRTIFIPLMTSSSLGSILDFTVNLSNPTLNGVYNSALTNLIPSATVTITNDLNNGTFQFSLADYTVNENGGTATLTVTRTGSTFGYAQVDFDMFDGNAVDPDNYTYNSDTVFFGPGESAQSFTVDIVDDGIVDNFAPADFTFQVQLSNPSSGATLGALTSADVHIIDAQAYNRPPGSVDVTFNANPGIDGPVFALAQQSDGSLIAGGSFSQVNGDSRNNFARLNSDGSTDVTGFLNGMAAANGAVYAVASQTDDRVVVGGVFTTVNGVARNHLARVMTDGSLDTSFNTGVGADDTVYSLAETFVGGNRKIYAAGAFPTFNSANRPFLVRLNNNGSVDSSFNPGLGPNGTVYAVAAYPTNSPYFGKVLIGGAFTTVNNFPTPYIARLNVDGSVDTNFDAAFGVDGIVRAIAIQLDGQFVIGGDFTNAFDSFGSFISPHLARIYDSDGFSYVDDYFAANLGDGPNGRVNSIAIQADGGIVVAGEFSQASGVTRNSITRLMADGTVDPTINFGMGANAAVYASLVQSSDQAIVLGGAFTRFNEQEHNHIVRLYGGSQTGDGAFEFTSASYQAMENEPSALITIRRTGGTTGTNTVVFATSDDTAIDTINYQSISIPVVFPPGEVIQTVSVPLIDDLVITPDLAVNLNLSEASAYGDQTNAVLTIQNVESSVAFSTPDYFVSRNVLTGFATIDVVRAGSTLGACTVDFITTTNGSAVPDTDFTSTNLTLTFLSGESLRQVQIPILPSGPVLGDRTVIFTLTDAVNSSIYEPSNATLTIRGTNQPGMIGFQSNSIVAVEANANLLITVIRTNGSGGVASVNYTTVQGSAVPGVNYTTTTGSLTFNDGETNRTIIVPLVENLVVQGAVNFSVNLTAVTGAALSAATQAVVTVLDNDAGINFVLTTNTAPENSGSANVAVQRLYNTAGVATVHYATSDGTASNGVNYATTSGTLTFTNGESLKVISVPLIDVTNVTGDLQFNLSLTAPVTGAQLIAPTNTVVIVQDADAGVSFTTNNATVLKNAGFAALNVVCSNPRVEPVVFTTNDIPLSVNYYTVDGTASAGVDYQSTSGTLVFTNGIGTNTILVPIVNNGLVNGNHTFSVVLTNVTAPGQITPYATQSVVIVDSNSGLRFSQSTYTAFENGITANINVFRTGFTDSVVTVQCLVTNGTALSGVNFVATNALLVFTNGVTTRTVPVALIANSQVQPNLIAQLQLLNPTNGILVSPSSATLTILETGGSYVIPAGAQIVSESFAPANGIVDSNETVQVRFAFRDSAGLNVTNLNAILLATNGVVSPSAVPASATNYGPLTVYGHSVSRTFSFTVNGTNAYPITPTFRLYDNTRFIGTAAFSFTVGSWTTAFTNSGMIVIRDNTNASPYPSIISVTNIGNTLIKATVTLNKLAHAYPADVGALVVAPSGTNTIILANVGGGLGNTNVTLTFDDGATNSMSQSVRITTSTNKPTAFFPVQAFP